MQFLDKVCDVSSSPIANDVSRIGKTYNRANIKASQHLKMIIHFRIFSKLIIKKYKAKKMKGQIVAAFAICFFAIASCRTIQWPRDTTREELFPIRSTGPYYPPPPKDWTRVRREANPQGGLTVEVQKPLSGPDRRPSVNLDYNHNLLNNGRTNVNAYGGGTWQQGSPVQPHAGMNFQHNFGRNGNGFVGGFGQVQPGPRGGFSPSFGVGGGFRFRRDLQLEDEETFDNLEEETFDNLE